MWVGATSQPSLSPKAHISLGAQPGRSGTTRPPPSALPWHAWIAHTSGVWTFLLRCLATALPVAAGWGCSVSTGPAGPDDLDKSCDTGVATAALFNGRPDPGTVTLSASQRRSIVAVVIDPGPAEGLCTGTLIADGFVLTAAHCATYREIEVRFGPNIARPSLAVEVAERHVHPGAPDIDVALLELPYSGIADEVDAEPVPIWPSLVDSSWVGDDVDIAGRGLTEDNTVGELLFATEPVTRVDRFTLTVDGGGKSGACVGDSGGPLLVGSDQVYVAGLLSNGSDTCLMEDNYVRVDRVRAWIEETMAESTPPDADPCDD